ncbi:AMP phosphorylase [Candidatus Woesearchaeota archaeon]|nr:AMP phosphorylase [Candidatus Woesearchaeota archaeon]
MKLKVRNLGISTGGPLVAALHKDDASVFDINPMDRIKIFFGRKVETVVADIASGSAEVKKGMIGLFQEVSDILGMKNGQNVSIMLARKPISLDYIKKKLDGSSLSKQEIDQVVWDIVHNKLSDTELAFFVAATYCNPNTVEETVWLTKAISEEGERLRVNSKIVLDKHSIGGIPGNRTTMVVVPIMAASGYTLPKTSSRAITSAAGTADTMEVIAKVDIPIPEMEKVIRKTGACIVWGGAINLAPADDKIINVEKTLRIDAESQLLASILAKKRSVSSSHVLIDIPIGKNAKVSTARKARSLKEKFEKIGKALGMKIGVMITDGSQPIGNGIGPALEARDVLKVLRHDPDRPLDLEKKCIAMSAALFSIVGVKDGARKATEILYSGKAYSKMKEIIALQGGNPEVTPESIRIAKLEYSFPAKKSGKIVEINNGDIAKLARIAGAPQNKSAGIYLYKHVGDHVRKGENIFTIYSDTDSKIEYAKQILKSMDGVISIR